MKNHRFYSSFNVAFGRVSTIAIRVTGYRTISFLGSNIKAVAQRCFAIPLKPDADTCSVGHDRRTAGLPGRVLSRSVASIVGIRQPGRPVNHFNRTPLRQARQHRIFPHTAMCRSAAPGIILRPTHHPRLYWVPFYIPDRRPNMLLIQRAGKVPPLPQSAADSLRPVQVLCPARISHQVSTAASDPGMSTALRSVGLLDVLSSTPAGPSVSRLVSMPVCAASLRNLVRNAG